MAVWVAATSGELGDGVFGASDGHYMWVTSRTGFPGRVGQWRRYEASTDTWTDMTRFGTKYRYHCAVAYHGGKVYLISGREDDDGGGGVDTAVTRVYDIIGDSWSTVASIPTIVRRAQAAVVADKIYVYGGTSAGAHSLLMQVYDIIGDSWSSATSLPFVSDLDVPNQAVVDGDGTTIHIVGGADYLGTYNLLNHTTYDTVGDTYSTAYSNMPGTFGANNWGPDGSGAFLNPVTGAIWMQIGFNDASSVPRPTNMTVTWAPDTWTVGPNVQSSGGDFRLSAAVDGGAILVAITAGTTDLYYQPLRFGYWDS